MTMYSLEDMCECGHDWGDHTTVASEPCSHPCGCQRFKIATKDGWLPGDTGKIALSSSPHVTHTFEVGKISESSGEARISIDNNKSMLSRTLESLLKNDWVLTEEKHLPRPVAKVEYPCRECGHGWADHTFDEDDEFSTRCFNGVPGAALCACKRFVADL